ncbi:hypothetical protein ACN93_21655, partial [Gordonia paraffinivorans]|uniref:M13-type metalloendopeptidase n=1 Tax=Gordonia paraffinivorans TaxID=175628 RepID=UPI000D6061D9
GENIGDLGGLSIALKAYQIATEGVGSAASGPHDTGAGSAASGPHDTGTEPPVIDGLTGVQRVFFSWAQIWRTKTRDAEAIRRL